MSSSLFDRHRKILDDAVKAIHARTFFSAYPEVPSGRIYGETAKDDGLAAFESRLDKPFELDQPGTSGTVGGETSPFGRTLGVTYPQADLDVLVPAAAAAVGQWKQASVETRVGVCLEILHRLNRQSFQLANAVMHTTGQTFMMAFQAGGPHAQDRGLEAVAYAYEEMNRCPATATWRKQVSKTDFVTLEKTFRIVPRGVAVLIGCSTFPTWNGYPGLFASLATGNSVIVKPHHGAILPLAITVEIARAVLSEEGFDPNLLTLAADDAERRITRDLAMRPEVGIIDYTGSSEFGTWLEENARHAVVFTEKAGVNSMIIDSIDDLRAVTGNLAFTLCLYSGQMCTTTQNIFIPKGGIEVGGEHKSFDEIVEAIVGAVDWLLSDGRRAGEILGAIQNQDTAARIDQARAQARSEGGVVVRESQAIEHEAFPDARLRTPLIIRLDAGQTPEYMREMFGPIAYIIATESTAQSIELAARTGRELGAITCGVYSTRPSVIEAAEDALADAGVPLSCNLVGPIYVNQSAAFSDFHVSGGNPSGNATLCDGAFVAPRFRVVHSRVLVPEPSETEAKAHAGV